MLVNHMLDRKKPLDHTRTLSTIFLSERQNVTAVTAPISSDIAEWLKPVWDPVVDFLFVRISFGIGLANTFGDDARITFRMTSVFAVLALHPC